ncbi:hypothetical protein CB1_000350073 [Camelus ferus]|nr:hypothetical protein CB1_000350073 [Camelus ferus]
MSAVEQRCVCCRWRQVCILRYPGHLCLSGTPASLSWCWNADDAVAFASDRGPLFIWTISGPDSGVTVHRDAHSFLSDICIFRWHTRKKGKVVFGHIDGSLSIFQPGNKSHKHVLRPESLEGTEEEDPVTALEWDPLSTEYLLVANLHYGIRLVDSESLCCITTFNFPSAAASVQCLAWVPSAPGMFITGVSIQSPTKNHYTSSTSEAVPPPTLTQNQAFSLPPGHAVCCFLDGGVGLYNMGAKKWDFLRDLSMETVYVIVTVLQGDCSGRDMIATGCEDRNVRVYYVATSSDQPLKVFSGHTEKVFHVKWSPLREGILCSGSDDGWDYTIKVWDTREGTCVDTVYDHGADVYDSAIEPGTPPLLCGKVSRDIKQEIEKQTGNPRLKKLRWFSECLSSEAQELTTVKMSKFGGGIGVPTKEERLKEAAEIHLRLGQIQRYCELMVELGEWDKALSVAPGVSVKYWKKLMQRRADQLIQEDKDDVIPYCIAIGDVKKLVNFLMSRGQLKEALLVAQAACEGNLQTLHVSTPKGSWCSDDTCKEDFNE